MERDGSEDAAQADTAYLEGRHAAERSEAAERNPHPPQSEAHRRWQEGHASVTASDAVGNDVGDFA